MQRWFIYSSLFLFLIAEQSYASNKYNIVSPFSLSKPGSAVWASGGVRVVEVGQSAAEVNNPATLFSPALTITAEFGKRFDAQYPYGIRYDGQYLIPAFASVALPLDNLNLSIGYYQPFNEQMMVDIPMTTEEHPDGTGYFFSAKNDRVIHALFISGSYRLGENISIGATVEYDAASVRDEIFNTKASGNGHGLGLIAGLHAKLSGSFSVGASVRYVPEFPIAYSTNTPQDFVLQNGNNNTMRVGVVATSFIAKQPLDIEGGVLINASPFITLMGSIEFQQWTGSAPGLSDVVRGHCGLLFTVTPATRLRLGYFTQEYPTKIYDALDQQFITGGFESMINETLSFTAGIQTSSIFTNPKYQEYFGPQEKDFHQMFLSMGITYLF